MSSDQERVNESLILKNAELKIKGLLTSIPSAKNSHEQSIILTKVLSTLEVIERTAFNDFFQIIEPIQRWIESKQKETLKFCKTLSFYSLAGDRLIIKTKEREDSYKIIPAEELLARITNKINPDFYFIQLAFLFKNENFIFAQLYFSGVKNK
jgi:hypothetical protein